MRMQAMVLEAPGRALVWRERPDPEPDAGMVRIRVAACGVCRTDLHVVDGELPDIRYPIVPGHEIVGRVEALGAGVTTLRLGERVGVPWLGYTCGVCRYCREGIENLCDRPLFTGYTRDGGYATHTIADARYALPLGEDGDDVSVAPLLCAGLIGWRSLVMAGNAERLGIYGFGAAGHIVAQVARWQGRTIYAFTGPRIWRRKTSPAGSARRGREDRISCPISRWMPRSSMRRPDSWYHWRCARCARAARSCARASI